jgi:hypothetical protein
MSEHVIRDAKAEEQGFSHFSRSAVDSGRQSVLFEYPSGALYRVPLEYLLSWYEMPHHMGIGSAGGKVKVERTRRVSGNHLVRVYLSDGRQYDSVVLIERLTRHKDNVPSPGMLPVMDMKRHEEEFEWSNALRQETNHLSDLLCRPSRRAALE